MWWFEDSCKWNRREVANRGHIQFHREIQLIVFLRVVQSPTCLWMEGKVPTDKNGGVSGHRMEEKLAAGKRGCS